MFNKTNSPQIKTWHKIFFLIFVLSAVGFSVYGSYWPKAQVEIGGQKIKVILADTYKHRLQGWSDKKDMGKYGGMLFVFAERSQHAMVMRRMNFSLDIVWIDGRTVVDIAPNLPPDPSLTEAGLQPYPPRAPGTLVLELLAGFAQKYGVKIGDKITIDK